MTKTLLALLLAVVVGIGLPLGAWAGPVQWQEVPASPEGRQWWDSGSLRLNRQGELSVLSRFSPAQKEGEKQAGGQLYVMAINCGERLFKDQQVNGLPQLGAEWQLAQADGLVAAVLSEACAAAHAQGLA